jgi:hypothetical protein
MLGKVQQALSFASAQLSDRTTLQNPEIAAYSRSRRLGFRAGSLDKNPKMNSPMKKNTTA